MIVGCETRDVRFSDRAGFRAARVVFVFVSGRLFRGSTARHLATSTFLNFFHASLLTRLTMDLICELGPSSYIASLPSARRLTTVCSHSTGDTSCSARSFGISDAFDTIAPVTLEYTGIFGAETVTFASASTSASRAEAIREV